MPIEYLDLSAESLAEQARHADALRKLEAQQRARSIIVPTDQGEIKRRLRELGHPVTLFGEGPADRRERLRDVIAALELNEEDLAHVQVHHILIMSYMHPLFAFVGYNDQQN
jgi:U4/U6 small nuclear ribonucleoprotein PRP4